MKEKTNHAKGNGGVFKAFKFDLKKLIFPIILFIGVIIIFFNFSELKEIFRLFSEIKWYFLIFICISQLVNIYFQGATFQSVFKIMKIPPFRTIQIMKSMVTLLFLNFAIPSLSFAGNFWLFKKISRETKVSEGKAIVSMILEAMCYYIAIGILIVVAGYVLFKRVGKIGSGQLIAAAFFLVAILIIFLIVYYFFGNRERFERKAVWFLRKLESKEKGHKRRSKEIVKSFYEDISLARKNKFKFFIPILLQLVKFSTEFLTINLVFLAFGSSLSLEVALIAFTFGRLVSIITFIPGGVGSFEAAMILILTSIGIPLELSISVTLVYRFFSYWLYFPFGLLFLKSRFGEAPVKNNNGESNTKK